MATKPKPSYSNLLAQYRKKHGSLVRPDQGFASLDQGLWLAYSSGRKRGFTDLGTHADKPGDHGYYPSFAFDLGHKTRFYNLGWRWWVARRLALWYVDNHKALNINYVILGDRIWSRERPYWHPFRRDTSHFWHIHVSGVH